MLLLGASNSLQAQCSASYTYTNTGNSYNFTATVSGGVISPTYVWVIDDYNNNTTSTVTTSSPTLSHNFSGGSQFGYHHACLTVYDSIGCQTTYCDSVFTNTIPCAGFSVAQSHTISGNTVSFTSNVTGGTPTYAYAWNFHGLGTSSFANPSFTYPGSGWYAVDLMVYDTAGCQTSLHDSIYIASSTPCANASAGYQYSVAGNSASFYSYTNGFFPPLVQYTWDFGNGNYSYTANPTAQLSAGWNSVCLTVTDSMCTYTYCDSVYINGGTGSNPCANHSLYYTSSVSGNVVSLIGSSTGYSSGGSYINGNTYAYLGAGPNLSLTLANGSHLICYEAYDIAYDSVSNVYDTCHTVYCDSVYVNNNGTPCNTTVSFFDSSYVGGTDFYAVTSGFQSWASYYWTFGNGTVSTSQYPSTNLPNGWHNVCLTVSDSICTQTYCDSIFINNVSSPCLQNSVSFNLLFDNYATETSWTVTDGNGTIVANGGNYSSAMNGVNLPINLCLPTGCYTFNIYDSYGDGICCQQGQGYYSLVDDATGLNLASGSSFTYSESTNFCVGGATNPCGNTTVSFFDSSYVGGIDFYASTSGFQSWASYYWDFGNGTSSTSQYPSANLPNGWHNVCLTVSDSICTQTYCDSVFVNNTVPCVNNSATVHLLFDNYAPETSWTVTNANGSIVASGGNYSSTMNGTSLAIDLCLPTGCYNFNVYDTYGDGLCCNYGQGGYSVMDNASGAVLAAGAAFTYSETTNFCIGGASNPCGNFGNGSFTYTVGANGAVTFTPVNTGAQFPMNYSWDFGNNNLSSSSNPTFTFANGYHLVCVTADSGNCTYTYCDTIMVTTNNGNPTGPCANLATNINIIQDTINPFSLWMQPVVTGATQGAGFVFVWDFGDNTGAFSGSPSHIYNGFGSYVVCLMALDTIHGCISTFCDTITVDSSGNFSRNVTKPGFTVNMLPPVIDFFTSTNEVEGNAMTINLFPNPANSVVNLAISSKEAINGTVSILDITGKVAYTNDLNVAAGQEQVSLSIDQLPSGVYLVRVISETTQQTMKFIKE
jgi:hypothetical protein